MWDNKDLGTDMIELAQRRVDFILSVILHEPKIPLRSLLVSAYLQGMYDAVMAQHQ